MNRKLYRNSEVLLFMVEIEPNENFILNEGRLPNGWEQSKKVPNYRSNRVMSGSLDVLIEHPLGNTEMTIDGDSEPQEQNHIGTCTFTNSGTEKASYFCFSRLDQAPVQFSEQPVLDDGDSFVAHSVGTIAVVQGEVEVDDRIFEKGSLLKINTIGKVLTAQGKTYLGYLGATKET